jgi:hypothetical protein
MEGKLRMKCPHCEKELSDSLCPECGEGVLDGTNHCMMCGAPLAEGLVHVAEEDGFIDDHDEFDLDNRVLCSDGSCTGIVVGGKCTECGRAPGDVGTSDDEPVEAMEEKTDVPSEDKSDEATEEKTDEKPKNDDKSA